MLYFIKKDFSFYILKVVCLLVYVLIVCIVRLCKIRMASRRMLAQGPADKQQRLFDQ